MGNRYFIYLLIYLTDLSICYFLLGYEILVPQPGIEPMPPALGAESLNQRSLSLSLSVDIGTILPYLSIMFSAYSSKPPGPK